jgi:hypothetical protein
MGGGMHILIMPSNTSLIDFRKFKYMFLANFEFLSSTLGTIELRKFERAPRTPV